MKIEVTREPSANGCTIGTMTLDGVFECYTLEDVVREEKIFGETAIPAGTYTVVVSYSPRFKSDLPIAFILAIPLPTRKAASSSAAPTTPIPWERRRWRSIRSTRKSSTLGPGTSPSK